MSSSGYKPFPIQEFKTGVNSYLQPWIRPSDAFEPLVNAYINRGALNRRAGYTQFGNTLPDTNPVMGIMQYINQTTGGVTLVVASRVNLYRYDVGTNSFIVVATGAPTFTGEINNFFNFTNWQANSSAASLLFMVNNVNPVTTYNGVTDTAAQPTLTVDGAATTITTCLDVQVYKQRMLYIRPTLSAGGVQNQSIYWSAVSNATNVRTDLAGSGGFLAAPTGDTIQSTEFIRDVLVVFFTNSTWIFRFTGNDTAPFRWDKVNVSKTTSSPYASVAYDERCTSIGNTGLIACDGVNVQRYDIPIIDYYETSFSETYYAQTFSQRYDNLNQSWMLYVSQDNQFPLVRSIAPGSDKALIYNFVENTWATYTFPIPLTCMGTFFLQSGATWASLAQAWNNTQKSWSSFSSQSSAPILLAGDTTGHIWFMDDEDADTDNGTTIVPDIVTTRWNPFIQMAEKTQFGYIDIYYYIASLDPDDPIFVTLNFYVDNSENVAVQKILTLDGPESGEYTFKRIYINLTGQFVQMEIESNSDSYMQFIGFILWAKPSGRLTAP